ncbi:hypothetical protein BDR05DRAFT_965020 [Suillus weaverae]|nr:hypothetical protein BDR05DRAFT_965020 [Suillus weaverae]
MGSAAEIEGPDLRDVFDIEAPEDIDVIDDIITPASSSSTPGPITPEDSGTNDGFDIDESAEEDTVTEAIARAKRTEIVANGWWNKWALNKGPCISKTTVLRRCETTITPDGRQPGCRTRLGSAPPKAVGGTGIRNSPQFVIGKPSGLGQEERQEMIVGNRLEQLRCVQVPPS